MHYAELAIRKLIQKKRKKKGIYNANIVMVEVITLICTLEVSSALPQPHCKHLICRSNIRIP